MSVQFISVALPRLYKVNELTISFISFQFSSSRKVYNTSSV